MYKLNTINVIEVVNTITNETNFIQTAAQLYKILPGNYTYITRVLKNMLAKLFYRQYLVSTGHQVENNPIKKKFKHFKLTLYSFDVKNVDGKLTFSEVNFKN